MKSDDILKDLKNTLEICIQIENEELNKNKGCDAETRSMFRHYAEGKKKAFEKILNEINYLEKK